MDQHIKSALTQPISITQESCITPNPIAPILPAGCCQEDPKEDKKIKIIFKKQIIIKTLSEYQKENKKGNLAST